MPRKKTWLYTALTLIGGLIGGAVATQIAPITAIAARQAHMVEAEHFVLLDRNGSKRADLEVTPRGMVDLAMYDAHGRDRADFRVTEKGGASLGFLNQDGSQRVLVGEALSGRSGIALYGTGGEQLVNLAVTQKNEANLTLYDPATGRARAGLGVASGGAPALVLFDREARDRAELHVTDSGRPGLALADQNGKTIAGLPEETTTGGIAAR